MQINIARIKRGSFVDGPGGPRTVVWLQGCTVRCKGCQNWALWPAETSDMMSLEPAEAALMVLKIANGEPITITGGEPFDQAAALGPFVAALKTLHLEYGAHPAPHVLIYTGRMYEDLVRIGRMEEDSEEGASPTAAGTYLALDFADALVDGPYCPDMDNPHIQWRGSQNQRPINLVRTRNWCVSANHGGWLDDTLLPITMEEDWDIPTIEIVNGVIIGTGGLLADLGLEELGLVKAIERCGEYGIPGGLQ